MRYFLVGLLLVCLVIVGIAGFRGTMTRNLPLRVFPDMDNQPKVLPQKTSDFFADQRSSRRPVEGTIARGEPFQDVPFNTGQVPGETNFVEALPVNVTPVLLERGRERFEIYCAPCHGATGDGTGITQRLGMNVVANLHDARIVRMSAGELFHVITDGRNLMGAYGSQVPIEDRWAIVAYLRALQLSRLASLEDVPEEMRAELEQEPGSEFE